MGFILDFLVLGLAASTVTAGPQGPGRPGGRPPGGHSPGRGPPIRGPPAPPSGQWSGNGRSKSPAYNYMFQYPLRKQTDGQQGNSNHVEFHMDRVDLFAVPFLV
jgi:hypothetical protein